MWALSPFYPLSVCFTCVLKMGKVFKCAFLLLTKRMNLFYLLHRNVDKLNFTINLSLPRIVTVFDLTCRINFHQRNFLLLRLPSLPFNEEKTITYCRKKFSSRLIVYVNVQSLRKIYDECWELWKNDFHHAKQSKFKFCIDLVARRNCFWSFRFPPTQQLNFSAKIQLSRKWENDNEI